MKVIVRIKRKHNLENGFTLIEATLVMLTTSIFLGFLLDAASVRIQNAKYEETEKRILAINKKIQEFLSQDQRLPCVSSFTVPTTQQNFGREILSANPNILGCDPVAPVGTFNATSPDLRVVRIGMVPIRTLNLPDNYAFDGWGNRILYAVTLTQAQAGLYISGNGGVGVIDYNGVSLITPPNRQDYVLVAAGSDRQGHYSIGGTLNAPCTDANTRERENCDMNTVFRYAARVDNNNPATNFDDHVAYLGEITADVNDIPSGTTLPFERGGKTNCPFGWVRVNPQPTGVFLYCKKV